MTTRYTRLRRAIQVPCPNCLGGGYVATKHGPVRCPDGCDHGSVERWLTEIVAVDEQEQSA